MRGARPGVSEITSAHTDCSQDCFDHPKPLMEIPSYFPKNVNSQAVCAPNVAASNTLIHRILCYEGSKMLSWQARSSDYEEFNMRGLTNRRIIVSWGFSRPHLVSCHLVLKSFEICRHYGRVILLEHVLHQLQMPNLPLPAH